MTGQGYLLAQLFCEISSTVRGPFTEALAQVYVSRVVKQSLRNSCAGSVRADQHIKLVVLDRFGEIGPGIAGIDVRTPDMNAAGGDFHEMRLGGMGISGLKASKVCPSDRLKPIHRSEHTEHSDYEGRESGRGREVVCGEAYRGVEPEQQHIATV